MIFGLLIPLLLGFVLFDGFGLGGMSEGGDEPDDSMDQTTPDEGAPDTTTGSFGTDSGSSGTESQLGGSSNDNISGTGGSDTLLGRDGDDTLSGLGGNDSLNGGSGLDLLLGGSGNDFLSGMGQNDQLRGGEGADILGGGNNNDLLIGEVGNDTLFGNAGNDTLSAGSGADLIVGGDGTDSLSGGDGNDTIMGGASNFQFSASGPLDWTTEMRAAYQTLEQLDPAFAATATPSQIFSSAPFASVDTSPATTAVADTSPDFLSGGAGNDVLFLEDGDIASGDAGDDTFMLNGDGAVTRAMTIRDYTAADDMIVVQYDASLPEPTVTVADNAAHAEISVNGSVIASIHNAAGALSAGDISLVAVNRAIV